MKYWPADFFPQGSIPLPPTKPVEVFQHCGSINTEFSSTVPKLCEESSLDRPHRKEKKNQNLIFTYAENDRNLKSQPAYKYLCFINTYIILQQFSLFLMIQLHKIYIYTYHPQRIKAEAGMIIKLGNVYV